MQGVPAELSSKIAWACLAVALLRAGLVIRHRVLATHWLLVIRLGVLPCLKEITTLATVTVRPWAPPARSDLSQLLKVQTTTEYHRLPNKHHVPIRGSSDRHIQSHLGKCGIMHGDRVVMERGTDWVPLQGVLFRLPPLLAIAGAPILAAACPVALATRLARLRGVASQHERLAGALLHVLLLLCNCWLCGPEHMTKLRTAPQTA